VLPSLSVRTAGGAIPSCSTMVDWYMEGERTPQRYVKRGAYPR
jgi:hypothetical protein